MQKKNIMGRNYPVNEDDGMAELTQPLNPDGSKDAELTRPQENDEDVITPEDIANMTPEEFSDYIESRPEDSESTDGDDTTDMEESEGGEDDPETGSAPYRTFNTQEEYEADRKKAIEEAFRKRFGASEGDAEINELKRIRKSARGNYRDSENPIQDMLDDIDSSAAKRSGQSVEDYRRSLDDNEAFEQWKAEKAQAEQQRKANERIIAQWYADAARLQQLVPEFDFNAAIQNAAFNSAIRNGDSVALAYMRMNGGASKPQNKREEITQNVTSARRGTGGSSVNPATMSTSDYISYINKQAGRKLL
ncbi:MAG: hypothetical protein J1G06_06490 [Oscillospiraceae bacterium]|nr:hypothetical protein [Oscillospiraceae bacterium]